MKATVDHKTAIVEMLRKDQRFRASFIEEALNEEEPSVVLSMPCSVGEAAAYGKRASTHKARARKGGRSTRSME